MSFSTASKAPLEPAMKRRNSPLTAAAERWQGIPSRPAARGRRGFPDPASTTPRATTRFTPVPTPAHGSPWAIRVRRSPR